MAMNLSSKRLQIDKANQSIVIILSVAVFVAIFSVFVSKALLTKRAYQSRVIAGKERALKQLKDNIKAIDSLNTSYKAFVSTPQNIIGGGITGSGDRDGDNAKIVLDALPSKYDFPALTTSIEKILGDKQFKINSITGVDDEIAQSGSLLKKSNNPTSTSASPTSTSSSSSTNVDAGEPKPVPFTASVTGTYASAQSLIQTLEKSIRPVQVTSITLAGNDSSLQMDVSASTYYQSEKIYTITTKDIK